MKKVLIITYYWPPAGGPGVQRVLKFAKYLPEFGWQPIILTVRNGEYQAYDDSLVEDIPESAVVRRTPVLEPHHLYKRFTGMRSEDRIPVAALTEQNVGWKKCLSYWIRANAFIPDARIGWIPFGVREGKRIIRKHHIDVILSSSPPPTVHLIARKLARWSGLPWVADFRDPWTRIYHYDQVNRSTIARNMDAYFERRTLRECDRMTVVADGFFDDLDCLTKCSVIPNGYDADDLQYVKERERNSKFTIRYVGSMKQNMNITPFFRTLESLSNNEITRDGICVEIIGRVNPAIREAVDDMQIDVELVWSGYLDHCEVVNRMANSDLLLMFIGKSPIARSIMTGKLAEYLMMQRPILAFGPLNGAADNILQSTKAGRMVDFDDQESAGAFILEQFESWKYGRDDFHPNKGEVEKYDRKELTRRLTQVLMGDKNGKNEQSVGTRAAY